jgi:hypothetical protein
MPFKIESFSRMVRHSLPRVYGFQEMKWIKKWRRIEYGDRLLTDRISEWMMAKLNW